MNTRLCAYCLQTRAEGCRCKFVERRHRKDGRKESCSMTCENTSQETTLAEMLASIKETLPISSKHPAKARGVWKWSFVLCEDDKEG